MGPNSRNLSTPFPSSTWNYQIPPTSTMYEKWSLGAKIAGKEIGMKTELGHHNVHLVWTDRDKGKGACGCIIIPSEKCLKWNCVKSSKVELFPCNQVNSSIFECCQCLASWHSSWLLLSFQAQGVETADKQGVLQVCKLQVLSLPCTMHHLTDSSPPSQRHLSVLHPFYVSLPL